MAGRVANRYLSRAFRWRRYLLFAWVFWIILLCWIYCFPRPALPLHPFFDFALLGTFVACCLISVGICVYVYLGVELRRGALYASMHVFLIWLLMPVCFLGAFLIPTLANNDLLRFRDYERENRKG